MGKDPAVHFTTLLADLMLEGPVISMLHAAAGRLWEQEGIRLHVIRSPDFFSCDLFLVEGFEGDDFLTQSDPADMRRVLWAFEANPRAILCDIKAGDGTFRHRSKCPLDDAASLREADEDTVMEDVRHTVDVFFNYHPRYNDWLFVVPEDRAADIQRLAPQLGAAGNTFLFQTLGIAEFRGIPGRLAPYAVHVDHLPAMLKSLLRGGETCAFKNPTSQISILSWLQPAHGTRAGVPRRPIDMLNGFLKSTQRLSFTEVARFLAWLAKYKPEMRAYHVLHQPMGGDFRLALDSRPGAASFIIQHKAEKQTRGDWFTESHHLFHFLIAQSQGSDWVHIYQRNGSGHATFPFNKQGADYLVRYLNDHGESARLQLAKLAAQPRTFSNSQASRPRRDAEPRLEQLYLRTADSTPELTQQAAYINCVDQGRERQRMAAIQLFRYINQDPDSMQQDLACIYLAHDHWHPWGTLVVHAHTWTKAEREAFRRDAAVPWSWESILSNPHRLDESCVMLQVHVRHVIAAGLHHFPNFEFPPTEQSFVMIGLHSEAELHAHATALFLPSEFLVASPEIKKRQQSNQAALASGIQTSKVNRIQQKAPKSWQGDLHPSCNPNHHWLRPAEVLTHLAKLLHPSREGSMRVHHPMASYNSPNPQFQKAAYRTTFRSILQAQLDFGSLSFKSTTRSRAKGKPTPEDSFNRSEDEISEADSAADECNLMDKDMNWGNCSTSTCDEEWKDGKDGSEETAQDDGSGPWSESELQTLESRRSRNTRHGDPAADRDQDACMVSQKVTESSGDTSSGIELQSGSGRDSAWLQRGWSEEEFRFGLRGRWLDSGATPSERNQPDEEATSHRKRRRVC